MPTPGIDATALAALFNQMQSGLLGMVDLFSGGNLRRLTVFALGIMPYISASIILQLLTVVIPALERLAKEGEAGKKKITQYTRYGTIVLSLIQSFGIAVGLESMTPQGGIVAGARPGLGLPPHDHAHPDHRHRPHHVAGRADLREGHRQRHLAHHLRGHRRAAALGGRCRRITLIVTGELKLFVFLGLVVMMVLVTAAVIVMQEGQRKIPVQYAKRMVGRRMAMGQTTHIPLRINTAGVIPVIFASSLILFPATLTRFIQHPWMQAISEALSPGHVTYTALYCALIIFFTYFYTAIVFNPDRPRRQHEEVRRLHSRACARARRRPSTSTGC